MVIYTTPAIGECCFRCITCLEIYVIKGIADAYVVHMLYTYNTCVGYTPVYYICILQLYITYVFYTCNTCNICTCITHVVLHMQYMCMI